MTELEAIAYIENYGWSTTRLGLDRTRELLERLGDPQKELKFIHVAGSNGKGSACAMFDAILRAAGYKTGLYISPYLESFHERIQTGGENISGAALAALTERVKAAAEAMEDHPSQFELATAIAMLYYREQHCDVVVLEVGMGGALDSTNVIDAPELAVICNIGLEHTEYLGDTIEEIAATKAGIVKPGCACVCYDGAAEAVAVVRDACAERGVPFALSDFSRLRPISSSLFDQRFTWDGTEYALALTGPHQLHNAALVLTGVEALRARGWEIPEAAVADGLRTVRWPARMEVLSAAPLFLLDGGHNPQCAAALAQSLETLLPGKKVLFLTGVLADKDYDTILKLLLPFAGRFVCVTPESPRALPAEALREHLERAFGTQAEVAADVRTGVLRALEIAEGEGTPVVALGSFYLAGAVRRVFPKVLKQRQRTHCFSARRALSPEQRKAASETICAYLAQLPEAAEAGTIFSYRPLWDEVDLSAFHAWCAEQGKTVAYPVSHPGGVMDAWVPQDADSFLSGTYGIETPDIARSRRLEPENFDLVLVPCVGFDGDGGRLGHGAGYYDRYLPRCTRAHVVAVAFEAQRLEAVCMEKTDRKMDRVVTENGIFSVDAAAPR